MHYNKIVVLSHIFRHWNWQVYEKFCHLSELVRIDKFPVTVIFCANIVIISSGNHFTLQPSQGQAVGGT